MFGFPAFSPAMTASQYAAQAAYLAAYNDCQAAIVAIQALIHDMPAPDGETPICWGNVGDMSHMASSLNEIAYPGK